MSVLVPDTLGQPVAWLAERHGVIILSSAVTLTLSRLYTHTFIGRPPKLNASIFIFKKKKKVADQQSRGQETYP